MTTESGLVGHAYCLTREAPVAACVTRLVAPAADRHGQRGSGAGLAPGLARHRPDRARRPRHARDRARRHRALGHRRAARRAPALEAPRRLAGPGAGDDRCCLPARGPNAGVARRRRDPSRRDGLPAAQGRARPRSRPHAASPGTRLRRAPRPPPGSSSTSGFGWEDVPDALAELEGWGSTATRLAGGSARARGRPRLRRAPPTGRCPIGVGDELTSRQSFQALADARALDVLRLDVVAIGGITPAREVLALAAEHDLEVSLHVYPETSIHLAMASGAIVETFERGLPGGNPLDPSDRLVIGGPVFAGGLATASESVGPRLRARLGACSHSPQAESCRISSRLPSTARCSESLASATGIPHACGIRSGTA